MNKLISLAFILLIVLSSGCSKNLTGVKWNFLDKNKLDVQQMDFDYFSGKAKIKYKDHELDIKAKANIRIKKDSAIWIAFSSIGIQGARCLITQDSITIMNLVKKEYYVFYYDSLSNQFNFDVNYDAIQAVAMGNLLVERNKSNEVVKAEDYYLLRQKSGSVAIHNFIDQRTMKVKRVEMLEVASKNSAVIRYYDFGMVSNHAFPFSAIISLFYKAEGKTLNTVIEFEYSKADIEDKPVKFPFSIPSKYERK